MPCMFIYHGLSDTDFKTVQCFSFTQNDSEPGDEKLFAAYYYA